jgi:hypothetical protein
MRVKFNTSVSFGNYGSAASFHVVEMPAEVVKPFIDNGVAEEVAESVPYGTKIVGPVPAEMKPQAIVPEEKPAKPAKKPKKSAE